VVMARVWKLLGCRKLSPFFRAVLEIAGV
jgi:hypothetical protein